MVRWSDGPACPALQLPHLTLPQCVSLLRSPSTPRPLPARACTAAQAAVLPKVSQLTRPLQPLNIPVYCLYGTGKRTEEGREMARYVVDWIERWQTGVASQEKGLTVVDNAVVVGGSA